MPMPDIETKRLLLRMLSPNDVEDFAAIFADPEVMSFIGIEAGTTLSWTETVTTVEKMIEFWERNGFGRWSVIEKESGKLIGLCGLRLLEDIPELFYLFARSSWGKGYATEAALATLRFAFEQVGLDRIIAVIRPGNTDSIKVVKKIGMQFEKEVTHYGVEGVRYAIARQDFHPPDENDSEPVGGEMSEQEIDDNLEDTFPASDPPSWTLGVDPEHQSKTSDSSTDSDEK